MMHLKRELKEAYTYSDTVVPDIGDASKKRIESLR